MSDIKAEARKLIDRMPDDCTWDQLAHRFAFVAHLAAGLADLEAGRTIQHEQVMQEMDEWLASLGQHKPEPTSVG